MWHLNGKFYSKIVLLAALQTTDLEMGYIRSAQITKTRHIIQTLIQLTSCVKQMVICLPLLTMHYAKPFILIDI